MLSCKDDSMEKAQSESKQINHSNARTSAASSPIVLGYFPSWSDTWASTSNVSSSKLASLPSHITHVFLSFAKPNLSYQKGSYDISQTGIQVPYDGPTLKAVISYLKQKGTNVIVSLGGETYWGDASAYNINYQQIKDFVDDFGFAGIDWDFEPNGGFAEIGNATNVQRFIDFINKSRALMPKSAGYIIACAPAGCGALGGLNNDDPTSKYSYSKRNTLTGDTDSFLYNFSDPNHSISLFGFASSGHMIPVFKAAGSNIDIVAFQGYNVGAAKDRTLMFDSYAYYANIYGFRVAAGTHVPNEPWGPYYTYSAQVSANLAYYIYGGGRETRTGKGDGIMIWQLLATTSVDANYTGITYLNVVSKVLNGKSTSEAISQAFDYLNAVSAPAVSKTTGTVNTPITGTVASTGTLLIFKDGAQVSTQTLTSTSWSYTPTAAGSYTFKLQTTAGTSASSQIVTVTTGTTTAPAAPTVSKTTGTVNTPITGTVASTGTLLIFKDGVQVSTQTLTSTSWSYTPTAAGNYTFKLQTTAGTSDSSQTVTVTSGTTTNGCGYPAYDATKSYPTAGTRVYYNGNIYENKWWINPGDAPTNDTYGGWKFIQACTTTNAPAAPTVSKTTGTVNTPITGTVASTGTLLIFKDGAQVSTQTLTSTSWSYTPTAAGSYTFKLQTTAGTSASSQIVTVTTGTTTAPAAPTVSKTTGTVNTPITGTVASTGTLLIFKDGVQVSTQTLTSTSWSYTPTAAGNYTFKLQTTAGTSDSSQTVTVTSGTTTNGCGYPTYDATKSYPTAGTRVYYNGSIYESKWWINPGEAPTNDPYGAWKFIQKCN
ncbi:hypothetical protein [Emticicia sp. 17c]|uniref:hypothetical protein n=1 Tax=Emticicia sp. 17c TaxID=3127704 RepID=UPI00301C5C39